MVQFFPPLLYSLYGHKHTKTLFKSATNTLHPQCEKALRTFQGGWINFWVFKRERQQAGLALLYHISAAHTHTRTPPTLPHLTRISQIGCDSLALAV